MTSEKLLCQTSSSLTDLGVASAFNRERRSRERERERNFPQSLDLQLYPHMINIRQGGLCTGSSMSNYGATVSD